MSFLNIFKNNCGRGFNCLRILNTACYCYSDRLRFSFYSFHLFSHCFEWISRIFFPPSAINSLIRPHRITRVSSHMPFKKRSVVFCHVWFVDGFDRFWFCHFCFDIPFTFLSVSLCMPARSDSKPGAGSRSGLQRCKKLPARRKDRDTGKGVRKECEE